MKKLMQIGAAALPLLALVGCVASKIEQPNEKMEKVSETTRTVRAELSAIEPSVTRTGYSVSVQINLLGEFKLETEKVFASSIERDEYLAVGFFPGVMSCRDEYRNCLVNGTAAFFYNLVFVGLPTAYGLLMEPLVPYFPDQTDTLVGRRAFLKSTLIGFSRYSKPAERKEKVQKTPTTTKKIRLDDAIIEAPSLGIVSERGRPLDIPMDRLPSNGEVDVRLRLPDEHPLKEAMKDFENILIAVSCKK